MFHRMMHATARLFVILILLLAPSTAHARQALNFTLLPGSQMTTGASNGGAAWADYNNDNAMDLVITGVGNGGMSGDAPRTLLFENNGGVLAEVTSGKPNEYPGFTNVEQSTVDWADYNGDGALDALLAGASGYGGIPPRLYAETRVYENSTYTSNGAVKHFFIDSGASLLGVYRGRGAWGDYDSDGRPDFLLTGYLPGPSGDTPFTGLYHNDTRSGGLFSAVPLSLPALGDSYVAWGDYNRDGRLDFALMGKDAAGMPYTAIYRNDGAGAFNPTKLPGQSLGALAWVDFDSDGDLDLLVTGSVSSGTLSLSQLQAATRERGPLSLGSSSVTAPQTAATHLYRNDGGVFSEVANTGLPALWNSSMAFGDSDNNGTPDLLLNGQNQGSASTALWINDGTGHFSQYANITPVLDVGYRLSLAWGFFNNDLSLDALVTGIDKTDFYATNIYTNAPAIPNAAPPQPQPVANGKYAACWLPDSNGGPTGGRVVLRWTPPADDSTAPAALTYNVRAGTTPGGVELLHPAADLATGTNHLAAPGNAAYWPTGGGTTGAAGVTLTGLTGSSRVYWAVSAVDAAYAGGPFSPEQSFTPTGKIANADSTTTQEETPVTFNVTANDNDGVTAFAVDPPAHGTASLDPSGKVVYTPAHNFTGADTVTYYAIDPATGACNMASLIINVTNTPDAPTLSWKDALGKLHPGPLAITMDQDHPAALTLVGADPDPGETLTWSIASAPLHGATSTLPSPTTSGTPVKLTYTPSSGYTGTDTFTVRVTDSTSRTADLTVQAQVTYPNHVYLIVVKAP